MNGLIQSIFAKSPLKPLVKHICKVHECCSALVPFFQAVYADNWQEALETQQQIKALEEEADKIKMNIRMKLPKGLFMPVDRTDLLHLVTEQDKIANQAKDIAGIVLGRQLKVPEEVREDFLRYIRRCLDATLLAPSSWTRRNVSANWRSAPASDCAAPLSFSSRTFLV